VVLMFLRALQYSGKDLGLIFEAKYTVRKKETAPGSHFSKGDNLHLIPSATISMMSNISILNTNSIILDVPWGLSLQAGADKALLQCCCLHD
jgi:hypothetical protein